MKRSAAIYRCKCATTLAAIALALVFFSGAVADDYSDLILSDSPQSYWRLGDAGPGAADSAGANGGTASGVGVTFGQPSLLPAFPANSSVSTPAGGGVDRIVVPGFTKGPSYSVEYWVRLNSPVTGFHNIVGDGESGGDWFMMNYLTNTSRIRPHFNGSAPAAIDSDAVIASGGVYHVVTTYDNTGQASIYINGVLDKTVAVSANPAPPNTNNQIFIGRDNRENGGNLTIDEVALYSSPLTAAQVRTHYTTGAGLSVPDSLRHYWTFDESAAGTGTAFPTVGPNAGSFAGAATRTAGLVGIGAAQFNNTAGAGVNVGNSAFGFTSGIAIEALIQPGWNGSSGNYDEIFRKEDGGNRILLSFQNDGFFGGSQRPIGAGPALSFGLNTGGYGELDMPLNVDLTALAGGNPNSGTIFLSDPNLDGDNDPTTLGAGFGPNDVILNDGLLHQVVAQYDQASGEKSIWIDGLERFDFLVGGNPAIVSGGGTAAFIGNLSSGGEPFTGIIDELAIFDQALSASEIEQHFLNALNGQNYFFQAAAVPEPASLLLWSVMFASLAGWGWRRKRRST